MAQQINLSVNQIQVLPDSMCNMEKLEILRINDNWLQEIPACSKGWIACMDLQVKNNKIRRIAPEIGEVSSGATSEVVRGNYCVVRFDVVLILYCPLHSFPDHCRC